MTSIGIIHGQNDGPPEADLPEFDVYNRRPSVQKQNQRSLNFNESCLRSLMVLIHNDRLLDFLRYRYSLADVRHLTNFLSQAGTFYFPALRSGLYPAAHVTDDHPSGYSSVWVRDNVHVAHALLLDGQVEQAVHTVRGLLAFQRTQLDRVGAVIAGDLDHGDPMNRPHIRFDGRQLIEINERWAHAQNDALGYLLWMVSRLLRLGHLPLTPETAEVLAALVLFLRHIDFHRDEDSGHWEETRKPSASSIGVATAGLNELRHYCEQIQPSLPWLFRGQSVTLEMLDELIRAGRKALDHHLPFESRGADPLTTREADAALLFLIYPLEIVTDTQAEAILQVILPSLQGDIGIRRYRGDSYWCADYKQRLAPEQRSADYSEDLSARDAMLRAGEEAQWCIFDPIVSAIYGERFARTSDKRWLELQTYYLNRSLGHLTADDSRFGALRCPESYYLDAGRYVPVDQTPLLWTQANLLLALRALERNLDH